MKALKPYAFRKLIEDIDLHDLRAQGIANLLVDLEGTLVAREDWQIIPNKLAWIKNAVQSGFRVCLLSNTFKLKKAREIARRFDLPMVSAALKPLPLGFKRAMKILGAMPDNSIVIGDQLFMDILGGNLLNMKTLLVEPISEEKNIFRKLMRKIEGFFYRPAP